MGGETSDDDGVSGKAVERLSCNGVLIKRTQLFGGGGNGRSWLRQYGSLNRLERLEVK